MLQWIWWFLKNFPAVIFNLCQYQRNASYISKLPAIMNLIQPFFPQILFSEQWSYHFYFLFIYTSGQKFLK